MYLLYQLLEPDIPDMTRLETYFFEPINILSDIRAGLYDGTGVSARLICGYIRRKTREYEMGTFVNSMGGDYLHGQGIYYWPSGSRYEGEGKDDKRHGQGTYYCFVGSRYEGQWKDDRRHGQGTEFYSHGHRYEGEWKYNTRHGQGTSYRADGSVEYTGKWKNN